MFVAPQISEVAHLNQRLKEIGAKSPEDLTRAMLSDRVVYGRVMGINQEYKDVADRAEEDWADAKQQRPLVFKVLDLGCFCLFVWA